MHLFYPQVSGGGRFCGVHARWPRAGSALAVRVFRRVGLLSWNLAVEPLLSGDKLRPHPLLAVLRPCMRKAFIEGCGATAEPGARSNPRPSAICGGGIVTPIVPNAALRLCGKGKGGDPLSARRGGPWPAIRPTGCGERLEFVPILRLRRRALAQWRSRFGIRLKPSTDGSFVVHVPCSDFITAAHVARQWRCRLRALARRRTHGEFFASRTALVNDMRRRHNSGPGPQGAEPRSSTHIRHLRSAAWATNAWAAPRSGKFIGEDFTAGQSWLADKAPPHLSARATPRPAARWPCDPCGAYFPPLVTIRGPTAAGDQRTLYAQQVHGVGAPPRRPFIIAADTIAIGRTRRPERSWSHQAGSQR